MGTYIHFADEQKLRANNVDLVDFLERQGEKLIRSGPEKRLASDHSITVRGNEWYDHATESGGYAIDFVRQFYNLTFPEAVTMLLGGEQGKVYEPAEKKKQEQKKPFALPDANSDMRRVYGYLVKTRLLDREVVSYFAKQKLIYESCEKSKDGTKEYHNAVFVGLDENGVPRHAHKRGLYTEGTGFKGNVDSCNPAYGQPHRHERQRQPRQERSQPIPANDGAPADDARRAEVHSQGQLCGDENRHPPHENQVAAVPRLGHHIRSTLHHSRKSPPQGELRRQAGAGGEHCQKA